MYFIFKRIMDILFSLFLIILLSPIMLIVSFLIFIDSGLPVIFKQGRLGKNGVPFTIYKFRTMIVNAEKTGTGLFNYEDDPRVTKIGKFLRLTSLDEIPQLFNILKGDMSFIGPRPPVTYELGNYEDLSDEYKNRFAVLPGITGLAQVSGRNELEWDEKIKYDNKYIKEVGIVLDIKIFFLTILKVFAMEGSYEIKKDENDKKK